MKRAYRQTRRAEETEARRRKILESVGWLMLEGSYDDMTLAAVARRAGVSLKTVTRQFGSKEQLLREAMGAAREEEEARRDVPAGDLEAVVEVLAARYDEMAEPIYRMGDVELRYDWLSDWVQMARESHLRWLAHAFSPWIPAEGPERERRLMSLFVATEIRSWWSLRNRLGQDRDAAAFVMRHTLEALVAAWGAAEGGGT